MQIVPRASHDDRLNQLVELAPLGAGEGLAGGPGRAPPLPSGLLYISYVAFPHILYCSTYAFPDIASMA